MSAEPISYYAVIGTGIASASIAYQLSVGGRDRVLVLEREPQPGYHSTGRSTAMFTETCGTPTIRALTRTSRTFYEHPPEGFTGHPLLTPRGVVYIASKGQRDLRESPLRYLSRSAPATRSIRSDEAPARVPVLRAPGLCGAILEEDAQDGMDCTRWPAVVGIDESFHFKPDAAQLLGSPANADPATRHDVVPEEFDIALGIHRIQEATTLLIRRPYRTWAGLHSFVCNGDFVLGWDDARDRFFWLAAQGGYGIQTAAAAAELAAALLRGESLPARPVRQGVEPATMVPSRLR